MNIHVVSNDSTVFLSEKGDIKEIFGGRYTEVRNFCHQASEFCDVTISVITGSQGLVTSPAEIEKYSEVTDNKEAYLHLEKKFSYSKSMWEISKECDVTIIFVPKDMLQILINQSSSGSVISVANRCFQDEFLHRGWHYFERRGARIGKQNTEDILSLLRDWVQELS